MSLIQRIVEVRRKNAEPFIGRLIGADQNGVLVHDEVNEDKRFIPMHEIVELVQMSEGSIPKKLIKRVS